MNIMRITDEILTLKITEIYKNIEFYKEKPNSQEQDKYSCCLYLQLAPVSWELELIKFFVKMWPSLGPDHLPKHNIIKIFLVYDWISYYPKRFEQGVRTS